MDTGTPSGGGGLTSQEQAIVAEARRALEEARRTETPLSEEDLAAIRRSGKFSGPVFVDGQGRLHAVTEQDRVEHAAYVAKTEEYARLRAEAAQDAGHHGLS